MQGAPLEDTPTQVGFAKENKCPNRKELNSHPVHHGSQKDPVGWIAGNPTAKLRFGEVFTARFVSIGPFGSPYTFVLPKLKCAGLGGISPPTPVEVCARRRSRWARPWAPAWPRPGWPWARTRSRSADRSGGVPGRGGQSVAEGCLKGCGRLKGKGTPPEDILVFFFVGGSTILRRAHTHVAEI